MVVRFIRTSLALCLAAVLCACCSRDNVVIDAGADPAARPQPVSLTGRALSSSCSPLTAEAERLAARFRPVRQGGPLRLGSDRLFDPDYLPLVAGRRTAIMANQTSRATVDRLIDDPRVTLAAIFAPEHGFEGKKAAGVMILDDAYRGVPVYARYGGGDVTRRIPRELLKDIDVLLFELQDLGTRHYTYISHMYLAMDSAADADVDFVVLDRPVAVNGTDVEAPLLDAAYQTFVGVGRLPNRYAMTIGELALLFKHEAALMHGPRYPREKEGDAYWNVKDLKLFVVPMSGYDRTRCFDEQNGSREWIPSSPNIPSVNSAICYVGAGLFDGNTIAEMVRGYEQFSAFSFPFIQDRAGLEEFIALARKQYAFPGVNLVPAADPGSGRGPVIRLEITDRARFNSTYTALALLYTQALRYPESDFFTPGSGRRAFANIHASAWLVKLFQEPRTLPPFREITRRLDAETEAFKTIRARYLLY